MAGKDAQAIRFFGCAAVRIQMRGSTLTRIMMLKMFCVGLLATSFAFSQASAAENLQVGANGPASSQKAGSSAALAEPRSLMSHGPKKADFSKKPASKDARNMADWVVDSSDNRGLPFVVVDKENAEVFVFDRDGQLRGATPALLGLARGDDAVSGISGKTLSKIHPEERITPAGRFVAALGDDFGGQKILWVDYDAGIALHPVITTNPKEHRLQRLATPTTLDNRISYGCINVPTKFFQNVVRPAFTGSDGIVYILPERHATREVFSDYYDVEEHSRLQVVSQPMPAP